MLSDLLYVLSVCNACVIGLPTCPGWGHLNTSVVHMRDQRNAKKKKKKLFFEAEHNSQESGQHVPIFK